MRLLWLSLLAHDAPHNYLLTHVTQNVPETPAVQARFRPEFGVVCTTSVTQFYKRQIGLAEQVSL